MGEPYKLDDPAPEPAPKSAPAKMTPLLETPVGEPCPRCGKPLAPDAVVCVNCGFDMKANAPIQTGVNLPTAEPDEPETPAKPVFCVPGRPSIKTLGVVGGVLLLGAMIAAGAFTPPGAGLWRSLGRVLLTLYNGAVHSGTGVVAALLTATYLRQRLGSVELTWARVFVAFSAFLLVSNLPMGAGGWLGATIQIALGALAYWSCALLLFRCKPENAGILGLCHVGLYLVMQMGTLLSGAVAWPVPGDKPVVVSPAAQPAPVTAGPGAGPGN